MLHLQTGEIYLALVGQKQGHEHTETQKEAWYAAVSHSMPRLTWERAGAEPRETPPPPISLPLSLCFIPLGLCPDLILPNPSVCLFVSLSASRKKGIRQRINMDMRGWCNDCSCNTLKQLPLDYLLNSYCSKSTYLSTRCYISSIRVGY